MSDIVKTVLSLLQEPMCSYNAMLVTSYDENDEGLFHLLKTEVKGQRIAAFIDPIEDDEVVQVYIYPKNK